MIEITFNKVGLKKDFTNNDTPYIYKDVEVERLEVGLKDESAVKIKLPVASNEYFSSDNQSFRRKYEKKQLAHLKLAENQGATLQTPISTKQHQKLYGEGF